MIVAMAGLPGSGKSTIARALALRLSAEVISKDEIRVKLFRPDQIDYSSEQDTVCFDEMLTLTESVLARAPRRCVILDGRTFSRARDLVKVTELADRMRQPLYAIRCRCSDDEARRRLEADTKEKRHPAANRDYDLYVRIRGRQEPPPIPFLDLDTSADLTTCVSRCLEYLAAPPPGRTQML